MGAKISLGGNFNTAGSWAVVDATSLLDSEAGNTVLTTAYVATAAFTPGAITIDGIAVKLASRAASPSGTISVHLELDSDNSEVAGTLVTLNVADLPTCDATNKEGGWILFKFAAPVTLLAATAYQVAAKTSAATQVNLYRDATAGNWSRMLRTTTTGAPAATDQLDIMGEHTGAGTGNDITITMDQLAASYVDLGSGVDGAVAITVCKRGTLNYGFSAATNYYLKCSGNLIGYNGGTKTMGTVANPIPRDSTAVLEFDPVADGGMGFIKRNGFTLTRQGLSRTIGKNIVSCKLNTDEAIAQTILGVDADTGWLAGDEIGIASTTRTYSQCEKRTLSVNASATELTITAGLTYAHSGTSPTQAEVILLTRNVKIRSATSTIMTFENNKATSIEDTDWAEFYYLGENVAGKYGIAIETVTGSCNIQYSSLHDCEDGGFYLDSFSNNNITLDYIVTYNAASVSNTKPVLFVTATSGTSIVIDHSIFMLMNSLTSVPGLAGVVIGDVGITFTNITIIGQITSDRAGLRVHESGATTSGTFSNITIHSGVSYGLALMGTTVNDISWNGKISNLTIWRNGNRGIIASQVYGGFSPKMHVISNITIDTAVLFGNNAANISLYGTQDSYLSYVNNLTLENITSNGDSSFSTAYGIETNRYTAVVNLKIIDSDFSTVAGIKTAHTSDVYIDAFSCVAITAHNCKIPVITGMNGAIAGSYIASQKHGQVAGAHKREFKYGIVQTDAVIFRTAAPSARITPNNASNKIESGSFKVNVNSGQTCTPSVYVRESVVGDGADYNGNRIRLILKRNDAIGITADTVIATATVASEGAWELLTGTTIAATDNGVMEFVIDCDGTTGWANIEDASATVA